MMATVSQCFPLQEYQCHCIYSVCIHSDITIFLMVVVVVVVLCCVCINSLYMYNEICNCIFDCKSSPIIAMWVQSRPPPPSIINIFIRRKYKMTMLKRLIVVMNLNIQLPSSLRLFRLFMFTVITLITWFSASAGRCFSIKSSKNTLHYTALHAQQQAASSGQ